ncbi:squalene/phytoene synthase family protein [Paenarthrobacter sp. PH39-S1]|uniref:phytoene/squalene synthase family protein n=1 Tax=Paenarthrobacter sp. PH39-S1 TaxID=3046204 RepID=UPI0024B9B0E3|nr:squalene/phytoene synthase family protein [Paenarthrobacter sp. PH39-S1]MDJ0355910.1 squalene/phytoene synthase family protein [Paenarthrobacter sp. PH39-S1]
MKNTTADLYDRVAAQSAAVVIRQYSTSFSLAVRLLAVEIRPHVANVYALVRIADEMVDGAAAAKIEVSAIGRQLDDLEAEVERAIKCGYSTNLIVHAFARTARAAGFGQELTRPFFSSMRSDLQPAAFTRESFEQYIYGSAEVIGLMCLRAFLIGQCDATGTYEALKDGARHLGAAFQKINFLRDLSMDFMVLGRSYFPDLVPDRLTDAQKDGLLDDIDRDLLISKAAISALPPGSRRAVALAHALFSELSRRTRRTPANDLLQRRIRVPNRVKLRLVVAAALTLVSFSRAETPADV